jgi:Icc-related predicted phosphoesterase
VYKAQVLIVGGDVAGKAITPVFKEENGNYTAEFQGTKRTVPAQGKELDDLMKDIRSLGNYAYFTTRQEWVRVTQDPRNMNEIFDVQIREAIERWSRVARERLAESKVRVIINKGNDDPPSLEESIIASEYFEYPNEKVLSIDDSHEMVSLGYSNMTPWRLPGDVSEEELEDKLSQLVGGLKDLPSALFNIHVPPFDTLLDIAPRLDRNLRPILAPGGEPEFAHVGSTAVRKGIEKFQPLLSLHGHIHESKGYTKIGRTHCFNPGSEYQTGVLKGIILDLSQSKLDNYLFTTG